MRYLIGLDLGSGNIRAGAIDLEGNTTSVASRPSVGVVPDPHKPGQVVWRHSDVWVSTCAVLQEVVAALPAGAEIAGVSTACLGMDGLPLDREGTPLYDFIAWTDSRCTPYHDAWLRDFTEARQFMATGTAPRGFSTLFRLQWMRDHHPEIYEITHKWVLMGDFVGYRLSGELATDFSMAACTLMFAPDTMSWSKEIAEAAGVDIGLMCDARPAGTLLGQVTAAAARQTGLPEGTPVVIGGHDYLCGALPVGGHTPGTVVNIGGTWEVIQATLPDFRLSEAAIGTGWTVEPHVAPGMFSAYGAAIGGAVTTWFRNAFAGELSDAAYFQMAMDAARRQCNDLLFLPHLAGATGPVMDSQAAGAFLGLRPTHTATDLLSAVFEGLNFQTREILAAAECLGVKPKRLILVGGNARNPGLVQSKANAVGLPVDIPQIAETTVQGAALLAGLGSGDFADITEAVDALDCRVTRTEPEPEGMRNYDERLDLFRTAYTSVQGVHHALAAASP